MEEALATDAPKDSFEADLPPNDDLDHEAATLDSVRIRASAPLLVPPAAAVDDEDEEQGGPDDDGDVHFEDLESHY